MYQKRTTTVSSNGSQLPTQPEPEVVLRAKRRIFTTAYKLRMVQEADECNQPGQIGALLRREGLYSSHLSNWRRQREAGQLAGVSSKKRGRQAKVTAREEEMAVLRQENKRLQSQLAQAELIITAQKKLAQALEQTLIGNKEVQS